MDWIPILTQAGIEVLKGGINFVNDRLKTNKEADEAQEISEKEAKTIVSTQTPQSNQISINWNNVGTLFWLGNDLMWIQDMMYRGAMPERVLQGIENVRIYFNELGFDNNSFPLQQLNLAQCLIEPLKGVTNITPDWLSHIQRRYKGIEKYITTLKWYMNAFVEEQQPGFNKLRAI